MSEGRCKYNDRGDTSSKRGLKWLDENVFSKEDWSNYTSILDVGSGNGRVNKIYKEYFKEIYNIEPSVDLKESFNFENVTLYKTNIENFETNKKFDVIVFIFSFYLFFNTHKEILDKCFSLLNKNGCVLIIEETVWAEKMNKNYKGFNLEKLKESYNHKIVPVDTELKCNYIIFKESK